MLTEILQYYLFGIVVLSVFAFGYQPPATDVNFSETLIFIGLLLWPLMFVICIANIAARLVFPKSNQKEELDEN